MKATTFIQNIMKERGFKQSDMAKKLGLKTQSVVSGRLRNGNITMSNAIEMLDLLDYEVYAVPKGYGKNQNITAEPVKMTVTDGSEMSEDDMILASYKRTLTPDGLEKFESKPLEIQLQIAKMMA